MRFFSNESRQTHDDQARVEEHPERVSSEPVAVPAQRPASPWAASPGAAQERPAAGERPYDEYDDTRPQEAARPQDADLADDELAAQGARDRSTDDDRTVRDDGLPGLDTGERPPFHEPAAQPTAFGAGTPGGAVAASALANPMTHADPRLDRDIDRRTGDDPAGASAAHRSDEVDLPLEDGGTFEDPVVVEPGGDARTFAGDRGPDAPPSSPAMGAGPTTVPADMTRNAAEADGDSDGPAEQLPGTVPAPQLGPLFADSDAHAFRDRWRDVQLRFVDDPRGAADDAAALIDEAVDALANSLRSQKDQLAGAAATDSAHDTEQLRVRLRSYRDFLDRLLDL
jgi:hypothetical protein